MENGCKFSRQSIFGYVCNIRVSSGGCLINCKGSIEEKKICPEWGKTLEIENYYNTKIKEEKKLRKEKAKDVNVNV